MDSIDSEIVSSRLKSLSNLIRKLKWANESTTLLVTNYFDEIIRELDLNAEESLIRLQKTTATMINRNDDTNENQTEKADNGNQKIESMINRINEIRETILGEIKSHQTALIEHSGHCFDDFSKQENDHKYRALKAEYNEIIAKEFQIKQTNHNYHRSEFFKYLKEMNRMREKIENELNRMCETLFKNHTFIYFPIEGSIGNLVVIDFKFLNEREIDCMKKWKEGSIPLDVIKHLNHLNYDDQTTYFDDDHRSLVLKRNACFIFNLMRIHLRDLANLPSIIKLQSNDIQSYNSSYFSNIGLCSIEEGAFEFALEDKTYYSLNINRLKSLENISAAANSMILNWYGLFLDHNLLTKLSDKKSCLQSLQNLNRLDLNGNYLLELDENLFEHQNKLLSCSIRSNRIKRIASTAFTNCELLNDLDLGNNHLTDLDPNVFSPLISLAKINLPKNTLKSIDQNWFKNCRDRLSYANFIQNDIEAIRNTDFRNLSALNELNLNSNRIELIEKDSFEMLKNLNYLNLSGNKLKLDENDFDCFNGLEALRGLYLMSNQIEWIADCHFGSLKNLDRLHLEGNRIRSITSDIIQSQQTKTTTFNALNKLTSLENLTLEENLIENLDSLKLKSLCQLFLSNNRLTKLTTEMFSELSSLNLIDLRYNRIKHVHERAFSCCIKLADIDLSFNQLRKLGQDAFEGLTELETLELNYNQLIELKPSLFKDLARLKTLDLSQNMLQKIDESAFQGLNQLCELHLEYNQLDNHSVINFQHLNCLQSLSLSNNVLRSFRHDFFQDLTRLNRLLVDSNRLLTLNHPNQFPASLAFLDLSKNHIGHINLEAFRNLKFVHSVDLSHNRLSKLDKSLFHTMNEMRNLNLSHNRIRSLPTASDSFQQLLELNLKSNFLIIFHTYAFTYSNYENNAVQLNLSSNRIHRLEKFAHDCSFKSINLADNRLEKLDVDTFDVAHLNFLDLSSNRLRSIHLKLSSNNRDVPQNPLNAETTVNLSMNLFKKFDQIQFESEIDFLDLSFNLFRNLSLPEKIVHQHQHQHHNWLNGLASLNLHSNFIKSIESTFFNELSQLTKLNLMNNRLKTLLNANNINIKLSANLRSINLACNQIKRLDKETFAQNSELRSLILSMNQLESIDPNAFYGLVNLERLMLNDNQLRDEEINDCGLFRSLLKLEKLNLANNQLEKIHKNTFKMLDSLTSLDVSNNKLSRIDTKAFRNLNSLVSLNLGGNHLDNVTFTSMHLSDYLTMLRSLNLKQNKFTKVNFFTLFSKNLESVDLSENHIDELDHESFKFTSTSVKHINLSHNKIMKIQRKTFSKHFHDLESLNLAFNELNNESLEENKSDEQKFQCSMLKTLNLSNNKIESLNERIGLFSSLRNLRELNLCDNPIENIQPAQFKCLLHLNKLNLSRLKLTCLGERTFEGLEKLKLLDLSENQLEKLENNRLFDSLFNLDALDLSFNRIATIESAHVFRGMKNLLDLNLSHNKIDDKCLTGVSNLFKELERLSKLDLSFNGISRLDRQLTFDIDDRSALINLKQLDLSHNQIDFLSKSLFKSQLALEELNLSANQLKFIDADWFIGLRMLKKLDLSQNLIESLDEQQQHEHAFQHLEYLTDLNLSHNRIDSHLKLKIFKGLEYLELLNLSENQIEIVDLDRSSEHDHSLRILRELNLASNKIKDLKKFSIGRSFKHLERLYLQNNRIDSSSSSFDFNLRPQELDCLLELNLENNPMRFSSFTLLQLGSFINSSFHSLRQLHLSVQLALNDDDSYGGDGDADTDADVEYEIDEFLNQLDNLVKLECLTFIVLVRDSASKLTVRSSTLNEMSSELKWFQFNGRVKNMIADNSNKADHSSSSGGGGGGFHLATDEKLKIRSEFRRFLLDYLDKIEHKQQQQMNNNKRFFYFSDRFIANLIYENCPKENNQ